MKTRKMFSVVLVLLMLAGLMTAATAGAVDINEVTEGYYTGLVGPVTNESDDTKLTNPGTTDSTDITCTELTEDGNTFVTGIRDKHTVSQKNFGYPSIYGSGNASSGAKDYTLFNQGSGEYIVQAKVKWDQPKIDSTNVYRFKIDLNKAGLNYEIGTKSTSSQLNVNDDIVDYIHVKNSEGSGVAKLADGTTDASLTLQNDTWYTIRVVCNLDATNTKIISRLEIDDANGNNLITTAESEHTYTTTEVGFCRFYTNIYKQSSDITDPISCSFDDFMVVKTAKKPVTVTYDETLGTVSYNGTKAESGEKTAVNYNENTVFTISPKAGYKVNQVLVDGEAVPVSEDGTVTLTTVTDAHEISVTFKDASREYIVEPVDNTTKDLGVGETNNSTEFECKFVEENGNKFVQATRNNIVATGNNFIYPYTNSSDDFAFDLGSGEYVVQTKVRWNQPETDNTKVYRFLIATTNAPSYEFGTSSYNWFNVNDNVKDYIWQGNSVTNSNEEKDTINLQNNTWYTLRVVYNLDEEKDTLITRMEIDDVEGNNLITTPDLETECTDSVQFNRFYTNIHPTVAGASCAIDDFCIYKVVEEESQPETASVTVTYNEGGSVTYNGETITSGEAAAVAYNEDATFGIAANEGYEIESILVNGESVAVKDSVVLEKVTAAQTLAVTFKEKAIVAPAVDSDTVPQYVFNSENTSQVAYFVINPGYGYTFTDGIAKLYEVGNSASEEAPLKLESTQMLSDYANKDWDGRYGVRIHGTGLTVGNRYVLAPYWVAESGEESTVIDPVKEGDTEKYTFSFGTDK